MGLERIEKSLRLCWLCGSCFGRGPTEPHNWREINPDPSPNERCPSYEYFKFAVPKKSLVSDLLLYPSLTGDGRVRAEFNTNFDLELISDLYWDMGFYTSYDSNPVTQEAETIDYGINSSIAYKF